MAIPIPKQDRLYDQFTEHKQYTDYPTCSIECKKYTHGYKRKQKGIHKAYKKQH